MRCAFFQKGVDAFVAILGGGQPDKGLALLAQALAQAGFLAGPHGGLGGPHRQPTYGLGLIKKAIHQAESNSLEQQLELERDLQRLAGRSQDYREGVDAFLNKRSPDFKGC
nr:hypothetical protein [Zobellella denitrificans]